MIRPAKFADVPGIVALLQATHARSHYAKTRTAAVDVPEAKKLLVNAIQRSGKNGGCFVAVAEADGIITGIMLATVVRAYAILDRLMATDLLWVMAPGADPRDGIRLMRAMVAWAESVPGCIEVRCGATAVVQDPEKAGKILQRLGMEAYGAIYRKEFAR